MFCLIIASTASAVSIVYVNGGKTELALEDVELALNSVPWVADLRTHY